MMNTNDRTGITEFNKNPIILLRVVKSKVFGKSYIKLPI